MFIAPTLMPTSRTARGACIVLPLVEEGDRLKTRPSRPARRGNQIGQGPLKQQRLKFRNFPPPPKRRAKPLPVCVPLVRQWITERFRRREGWTSQALALLFLVRAMRPDDVLYCDALRLELVWLGRGYPHYRLYWRKHLYGVVDVTVDWDQPLTAAQSLPRIQENVAVCLSICGFTPSTTTFVKGDARTPVGGRKRELHKLFKS